MNDVNKLYFTEYNVDVEYLKNVPLFSHMSSSYLQVLLYTARFKKLMKGEKLSSAQAKNYLVFLVDGCVEKPQQRGKQLIKCRGSEPLFAQGEQAAVESSQNSILLMIDKTLHGIFVKEGSYRDKLNTNRKAANGQADLPGNMKLAR